MTVMLKKDAFDYGAHLVKSHCVGVHQTVEKEDVGAGRHLHNDNGDNDDDDDVDDDDNDDADDDDDDDNFKE